VPKRSAGCLCLELRETIAVFEWPPGLPVVHQANVDDKKDGLLPAEATSRLPYIGGSTSISVGRYSRRFRQDLRWQMGELTFIQVSTIRQWPTGVISIPLVESAWCYPWPDAEGHYTDRQNKRSDSDLPTIAFRYKHKLGPDGVPQFASVGVQ